MKNFSNTRTLIKNNNNSLHAPHELYELNCFTLYG